MMYGAEAKRRGVRLALLELKKIHQYTVDQQFPSLSLQRISSSAGTLREMSEQHIGTCGQHTQGQHKGLLLSKQSEVQRPSSTPISGSVLCNPATLRKPEESELGQLRRTGDQEQIQECSGVCNVYPSELPHPTYKAWTLDARTTTDTYAQGLALESSAVNQRNKRTNRWVTYRGEKIVVSDLHKRLTQDFELPTGSETHVSTCCIRDSVAGYPEAEGLWPIQEVEVFDIVNGVQDTDSLSKES